MMIPKIIHYCWFGGKALSPLAEKCIASWNFFLPDYKIIRWDESNYDFNKILYTRQAAEAQKWAFVTDYARLDILYLHGGIYFDVDVEVIRPFDELLELPAFAGFEHRNLVNSGLGMGAIPGNPIIREMRDDYIGRNFLLSNGKKNMTPCPIYQTTVLMQHGLKKENRKQDLGNIVIFPEEYFSPFNIYSGKMNKNAATFSIHWYNASWLTPWQRLKLFAKPYLYKLGVYAFVESLYRK